MSRNKKMETFYHSEEWKRLRADVFNKYLGISIYSYYVDEAIEDGVVVHHIIPIKDNWDKRLDPMNLILLTESEHQIIHRDMKNGRYNEVVKELQRLICLYHESVLMEGEGP